MFDCGPVAEHDVCGPARDTVSTNRQTEKLNFDTNYITTPFIIPAACPTNSLQGQSIAMYTVRYETNIVQYNMTCKLTNLAFN